MTFLRRIGSLFTVGRKQAPEIRFADFSEMISDEHLPLLDRSAIDETNLTADQRAWRRDGVLALRNFIPDDVTGPYIARHEATGRLEGWPHGQSYLNVPEMRDLTLYPPLMAKFKELVGEQMMLQLCLTGWTTTNREWHQDDYLNPGFVGCWYIAVWIALGDVGLNCGPFQYIPGSHRWPLMRGEKVRALLPQDDRDLRWERTSERFTTPAIEYELQERAIPATTFLAKRGDVLIWHSRLMHQGSKAKIPLMERRALIAHYCGVNHRPDLDETMRCRDQNNEIYIRFGKEIVEAGIVQGYIDSIIGREVTGWSRDTEFPKRTIEVEAVLDGEVLARTIADMEYQPLALSTFPDHNHGYILTLSRDLTVEEKARLKVRTVENPTILDRAPAYQGAVLVRTTSRVAGWARNRFAFDDHVTLQVVLWNRVISEVVAEDLHTLPDRPRGFKFDVAYPRNLSATERDALIVRFKDTKAPLQIPPHLVVEE